jgi:hypothetical protein
MSDVMRSIAACLSAYRLDWSHFCGVRAVFSLVQLYDQWPATGTRVTTWLGIALVYLRLYALHNNSPAAAPFSCLLDARKSNERTTLVLDARAWRPYPIRLYVYVRLYS